MRLSLATLVALGSLYRAPLQCSGEPDHAERRYEPPGEALYGLAEEFKARGEKEAWRSTLQHIVARYPNSRFALMAREDLERDDAAAKR